MKFDTLLTMAVISFFFWKLSKMNSGYRPWSKRRISLIIENDNHYHNHRLGGGPETDHEKEMVSF
nr:hypothetical protein [Bacillaceae bacterium]